MVQKSSFVFFLARGKTRVLSSETKKRLGFFSLNYNDTILHLFLNLKSPKNRLQTFPNRNCRFCVKYKHIPNVMNLMELAGYSLLSALLSNGLESFYVKIVLNTSSVCFAFVKLTAANPYPQ